MLFKNGSCPLIIGWCEPRSHQHRAEQQKQRIAQRAALEVPAIGYRIRYELGIFDQVLQDGQQVERTDRWLLNGNPWDLPRPESAVDVKFGGHTLADVDEQSFKQSWQK
jgi:hypothetical protein